MRPLFPQFWQSPHRPLFLCAALWAALAPLWWWAGPGLGIPRPEFGPGTGWHVHEMLFGAIGAAIGGYLLTAGSSWTGGEPPKGRPLALLVASWVAGRIASALAGDIPAIPVMLVNVTYFTGLTFVLGRRLLAAGQRRKLGFCVATAALGAGDAAFTGLSLAGGARPVQLAADPALFVVVALVVAIGGRAVPGFTRNWMDVAGLDGPRPGDDPAARHGTLACLAAAAALEPAGLRHAGGLALIAAGFLQARLLASWGGLRCAAAPLAAMLHAAWFWVPLGLMLVGLSNLEPALLPRSGALHALTMGAMGCMIIAIAGRATAVREARGLRATGAHVTAFALVWLSTPPRVMAGIAPGWALELIDLSVAAWSLGWLVFAADIVRASFRPPRRPVFSGPRAAGPGE